MELPFNHDAGPKRFEQARFLKKVQTEAESVLWERLRNRKLGKLKFRRQHPIDKYIADFYCHELKLIVEVDGEIHQTKEQAEYDALRTNDLESLGLSVIRFTNDQVIHELDKVLEKIISYTK
jgi:very-short-patch-repair endonuclease